MCHVHMAALAERLTRVEPEVSLSSRKSYCLGFEDETRGRWVQSESAAEISSKARSRDDRAEARLQHQPRPRWALQPDCGRGPAGGQDPSNRLPIGQPGR